MEKVDTVHIGYENIQNKIQGTTSPTYIYNTRNDEKYCRARNELDMYEDEEQ